LKFSHFLFKKSASDSWSQFVFGNPSLGYVLTQEASTYFSSLHTFFSGSQSRKGLALKPRKKIQRAKLLHTTTPSPLEKRTVFH